MKISNIQFDLKLANWLTIISRTGIMSRTSQLPGTVGSTFGQGYFTDGINNNRVFNTDLIARSDLEISKDFNLSLILGAEENIYH